MTSKIAIACSIMFCSLLFGAVGNAHEFHPRMEDLYGYKVDSGGISFQVYSGGCTDKRNFRLSTLERYETQIALYRVVPDYCLALFPYGVAVRFSYEELGVRRGLPFRIVNPFRQETFLPLPR